MKTPQRAQEQYARMFDELAEGHAPLAFNCSAGSDDSADAPHSAFTRMPEEIQKVFMGSDPIFIQAMFSELEKNHGSAMAYIQQELNVSDERLSRIRALYLSDNS